jgi:predicted nuclease of predicted toxin-antitoxin system
MRLKLDENLGGRVTDLFRDAGHEVSTVFDQGLAKAADRIVIDACQRERLCLVTLDLDFGSPLLFRPSDYSGIAVLRLPPRPTPEDLGEIRLGQWSDRPRTPHCPG